MKKKIAILICGEIRNNILGDNGDNCQFGDSFKTHLLNEDILLEYDINIFFVTDKINREKTIEYFGESIKGLLQLSRETIDEELDLGELTKNYLNYYKIKNNKT